LSSLRAKLAVWLLGPLLVLWAVNAWFGFEAAVESANRAHDRSLLGSVLAISERITVQDGQPVVDLPYSALEMFESNIQSRVYYRVTLGDGAHITGYPDLPAPSREARPRVPVFVDAIYRGDPVRIATLVKPLYDETVREPAIIQVAETAELRRTFARETFTSAALRELSIIALGAFLVWFAISRGLQPLARIRQQISARPSTDLSPIAVDAVPREVRPLVEAINEQTSNLDRALRAQRQFVSDAAHQLKTPLALLRTQADFAARQTDVAAIRPALDALGARVSQLSHLVDRMLVLSRAEGQARPEMQTVDLMELARKTTFDMLPVALRAGVDLGFEPGTSGPANIFGNEFMLQELLGNLIDNAVKFTAPGGRVTVRVNGSALQSGADEWILSVEDDGCGIPTEARERVFDRFYQVPGHDSSGSGLGLAIVAEIASQHAARVELADAHDGVGTTVRVTLPASTPNGRAPGPGRRSNGRALVTPALLLATVLLAGLVTPVAAQESAAGGPRSRDATIAAGRQEGRLVIYSTASRAVADFLLRDFRALHPQIAVDYVLMSSGEAYDRFRIEHESGAATADVVWSLAMDLQMKLVNDGFSQPYASPEAAALPPWAVWRNEAFGVTQEPAALVYNRRLLAPSEVPQSHRDLMRLLREQPERFRSKIAVYDVRKVGIGFLLATQDSSTWGGYRDFICHLRATNPQMLSGTSSMLERIASGESLLGYNLSGSYVIARAKTDPSIGYVLLRDYTLVLSRVAFIARRARHPNAARLWIDYLLSARGQRVLTQRSQLFAIRRDVEGESSAASLERQLGDSLKPVAITPGLLTYLDGSKRADFIRRWTAPSSECGAK
jgi:two-component system, OmpR family, sensor histidine kinase TctE